MEVATLFVIVLWHEIGHLLAALRFGWTVREVRLLPFGGVVEVEDSGALPVREEILVALAGPAQNVLFAAIGWLLGVLGLADPVWTDWFIKANVLLAAFNLLPILPLDGGKIVQAAISLRAPYFQTLLWCARISLCCSVLVILSACYPLLNNGLLHLNLLAIGLFLAFSNWTYMRNVPFVFLRFLVHRNKRSEQRFAGGAHSHPIVIADDRSLYAIIRLFKKEQYHLIYMMEQGKIARVVPEKPIIDRFLGGQHADFRFFM